MTDEAKPTAAAEKATGKEERYDEAYLTENAPALFSKPGFVVTGALYGQTKTAWTVTEATKLIEKFLAREVETGATEDEGDES